MIMMIMIIIIIIIHPKIFAGLAIYSLVYFCGATAQRGPWPSHSWVFYITQRQTTVGRPLLDE